MSIFTAVKEACQDYAGLVCLPELLEKAGESMLNRSVRRTTAFATVIFGAAVLGDVSNKEWITYQQAIGYTSMILGGSIGFGYLAKLLASFKTLGNIQTASANAFALLEDKKKSRVAEHLETLWEKVYSHEALMKYSIEEMDEEELLIKRKLAQFQ